VTEVPPVSVQVKSVPTVRVSVGVARISVPSVPWIVNLKTPSVTLPNVTVNGAPVTVGVTVAGVIPHVLGAPAVQINCTLLLYPFAAVNVPFQVTF